MKCWILANTLGNISPGLLGRPRVLRMGCESGESGSNEAGTIEVLRTNEFGGERVKWRSSCEMGFQRGANCEVGEARDKGGRGGTLGKGEENECRQGPRKKINWADMEENGQSGGRVVWRSGRR